MTYLSGGNELLDPEKIFAKLGIEAGAKVADLGCGGAGHFIIPAAKLVGEKTLAYAVDIQKLVLKNVSVKARMMGINNIKQIWSNLESLGATNINEQSLDFALLINTLFQSKKQKEIIRESVRLLKKGGKLLIIDWDQTNSSFGPPLENRTKKAELRQAALSLNLKLIEEFKPGNYHYGLIFEK
jgi:ubiquinone/menaquinone biosynthesis C-methylase UbiE